MVSRIRQFQNALVKRDDKTLSAILPDDAQLVKGGIARYFYNDTFGPYYNFEIFSTDRFISDIIDKRKPPLEIKYDDITVYKFPQLKDVFVATFYQQWSTGDYTDTGHVAMVVDLHNGVSIPLRVWQARPFKTGYLQQGMTAVTKIAVPVNTPPNSINEEFASDTQEEKANPSNSGFFATNKRWILLGLGASAAISAGTILLSGDSNSELPNPPGRPAIK